MRYFCIKITSQPIHPKSMKLLRGLLFISIWWFTSTIKAQTPNDLLNLLIENRLITPAQADSIRAEHAVNQQKSLPDKRIRIDAEFRPRAEYRSGYGQLPNDTASNAFFVNQRTRLGFHFNWDSRLALQVTLQDIRIWGNTDGRAPQGSLHLFEGYAEPTLWPGLSVRIGRQRLIYDNQRLFAENDWRMAGVAHDAVNIRYQTSTLKTELATAFNQQSEKLFDTGFYPTWSTYKFLAVHFLKYDFHSNWSLTSLQTSDGFQDKTDSEQIHFRFTNGGRIEFTRNNWYATLSGYYQWGHTKTGKQVKAWYIQPEVKYTSPGKLTARLGAEIFSGSATQNAQSPDRSFVPLYGVAHRFNGSMDFFTQFPGDIGSAGLINPYLFLIQQITPKVELRADFHTFYNQHTFYANNQPHNKYLGFENDWLLSWKPNGFTHVQLGVSWAKMTETTEVIKKAGAHAASHTPFWSYLSVSFKPTILQYAFK